MFCSSFHLIRWSPPTLWRAIWFKSTDSSVNLIQKLLHRYIQNYVSPYKSWHCGPDKLTYKINHHSLCRGVLFLPVSSLYQVSKRITRETQSHPHSFYFSKYSSLFLLFLLLLLLFLLFPAISVFLSLPPNPPPPLCVFCFISCLLHYLRDSIV